MEGWKEGGEQDRKVYDAMEVKPIYLPTQETFMMCLLFTSCVALGRHKKDMILDLGGCRIFWWLKAQGHGQKQNED